MKNTRISSRLFAISIGLLSAILVISPATAGWKDWVNDFLESPTASSISSELSESEIIAGLKQALDQASNTAIAQLGQENGYWQKPRVQLPLPGAVASAESFLGKIGQGKRVDEFHLSMNRAAEQAVPEGLQVLRKAVSGMTFDDARNILNGPDNAATAFFERTSRSELTTRFEPIIAAGLQRVGVTNQYEQLLGQARPALALIGQEPESLTQFTTNKALDGLFVRLADEEGRIRQDPAARSTELLKKVFAQR